MADAVRVALLARAGDAREQLRRALIELGAELAAEGDPSELDPAGLAQLRPDVVLISLEPTVDSVLDRFEAVLAEPGVQVMFDDAEVTRQLQGWDLARWARHLAAKLVGGDVLPPVPEGSARLERTDFTPRPGAPPTPSELMDHARLEDYTADADGLALDVPVTPKLADIALPASVALPDAPADDHDGISLDIDLSLLEQAMAAPLPEPAEAAEPGFFDADMDALERSLAQSGAPAASHQMDSFELDSGEFDPSGSGQLLNLDFDPDQPVSFSSFSSPQTHEPLLDEQVAALAAQLDALAAPAFDLPEIVAAPAPLAEPVPEPPRSPAALELALEGDATIPAAPAPAPTAPLATVVPEAGGGLFAGLSLSLVDETSSVPVPGLIVVLAGTGGPDAVRQLLANLPDKLTVPVALHQELHNGRFDRLAEQLAKGSRLPVVLGKAGEALRPGEVAVIPDGLAVMADGAGYRFAAGTSLAAMIRVQSANRTAVVVLSGADVALVPDLLSLHGQGALLLAQLPDACFDATAVQAVVAAGANAADPAELAARLGSHWRA